VQQLAVLDAVETPAALLLPTSTCHALAGGEEKAMPAWLQLLLAALKDESSRLSARIFLAKAVLHVEARHQQQVAAWDRRQEQQAAAQQQEGQAQAEEPLVEEAQEVVDPRPKVSSATKTMNIYLVCGVLPSLAPPATAPLVQHVVAVQVAQVAVPAVLDSHLCISVTCEAVPFCPNTSCVPCHALPWNAVQPTLFSQHAKELFPALVSVLVPGEGAIPMEAVQKGGFNYVLRDLVLVLLRWNDLFAGQPGESCAAWSLMPCS
jgi:hypothetical protein